MYKTDSMGHSTCLEAWDTDFVSSLTINDSDIIMTSIDGAIAIPSILIDTIYPSISEYNTCLILSATSPAPMTGIDSKMLVYPNPNNGNIVIQTNSNRKKTVYIYNSMGELVFEKQSIVDSEIHLGLGRYGKGIYLIKVDDGKKVHNQKVNVQ